MRSDQLGCTLAQLRRSISEHRALFRPEQLSLMKTNRRLALDAMRSLAEFRPRLSGALLHGDGPLDHIRLLLTAEAPEPVILKLEDLHIPWRAAEARLWHSKGRRVAYPACRFVAGDAFVELIILKAGSRNDPPRHPIDNSPLESAGIDQVVAMFDSERV